MGERPRAEHGHYAEEYPPERILAIFEELEDPCEPLSAQEVAKSLGCDRKTAFNKLEMLGEQGDLRTKKIGARARVWWLSGDDS
jgi:DNA-binding IclR family transcriptional regulator